MVPAFRVGFVTGATPDKWARAWRERRREPLDLVPILESEQEQGVRDGTLDMALMRLPVDRDGMHCISLYAEVPVVVASSEHFVAAADDVTLADLSAEQLVRPHSSGWRPEVEQLDWPPMSEKEAVETVAAGTGIAIMPTSIARLYQRKDVVRRPVSDLDPTQIGLVWLLDRDGEDTQAFVGVVRGRSVNSSR